MIDENIEASKSDKGEWDERRGRACKLLGTQSRYSMNEKRRTDIGQRQQQQLIRNVENNFKNRSTA